VTARPLSVALLTSARTWRGSGASLAIIAEGLVQRGHRAHLLAGDDEVVEAFARLGLPSSRVPAGDTGVREASAVARLLRPSRPGAVKLMNYECGAEPIGTAWVQFPVGFYLVALVFIVFDALAVFLFPWALVLRVVGLSAFWVMAAFVGVLGLGWLYAYREGVLEWK